MLFRVSAAVIELLRSLDLRMGDDSIASQSAEIAERCESALLHELGHAGDQRLDYIRADGVIEHRGGANLHGSAAEEEVAEGVIEIRDAADAGERSIRERFRHLRHLCE